jgi:hypothetical protein
MRAPVHTNDVMLFVWCSIVLNQIHQDAVCTCTQRKMGVEVCAIEDETTLLHSQQGRLCVIRM